MIENKLVQTAKLSVCVSICTPLIGSIKRMIKYRKKKKKSNKKLDFKPMPIKRYNLLYIDNPAFTTSIELYLYMWGTQLFVTK